MKLSLEAQRFEQLKSQEGFYFKGQNYIYQFMHQADDNFIPSFARWLYSSDVR